MNIPRTKRGASRTSTSWCVRHRHHRRHRLRHRGHLHDRRRRRRRGRPPRRCRLRRHSCPAPARHSCKASGTIRQSRLGEPRHSSAPIASAGAKSRRRAAPCALLCSRGSRSAAATTASARPWGADRRLFWLQRLRGPTPYRQPSARTPRPNHKGRDPGHKCKAKREGESLPEQQPASLSVSPLFINGPGQP